MSNEMDKIQELIERLTPLMLKDNDDDTVEAEPEVEVEVLPPENTRAVGKKDEKIGKPLSYWPEEVAAVPTELTRTSLFSLIRRGRRRVLDWETIASRCDVEVKYFGRQLDQADADLWLACLRLGRGIEMGRRIYIKRTALLREIGRKNTGPNLKWLMSALDRLSAAALKITVQRHGKTIHITTGLLKYGIDEETDQMFIRLDPDGAALLENLTYVDWDQRLNLKSNAAKSLQLYVCGHKAGKPHAVPIADLARWMGYEGRLRQFKSDTLRRALDELEAAGVIEDAKISKRANGVDIVSWKRT